MPTPQELVEKMLDMAKVTPQDIVIDLGSGDGRNVIAAAKRGARAYGFEFNPEMVALSRRRAQEAGVADRATFIEGDMFEADISKATVLALFLLPSNLDKLAPKFLALRPGTRMVNNTFQVTGWEADATETVEGSCTSWCTSHLNIIPAKAAGTWRLGTNDLTLTQEFQMVSGTLGIDADRRRPAERRADLVQGRRDTVHRQGGRRSDGRHRHDRRENAELDGDEEQIVLPYIGRWKIEGLEDWQIEMRLADYESANPQSANLSNNLPIYQSTNLPIQRSLGSPAANVPVSGTPIGPVGMYTTV